MPTPFRLRPLHDTIERLVTLEGNVRPRWDEIGGMPIPLDFGDPAAEQGRARELGLCDLSALARLVVKGPQAGRFLQSQGLPVPEEILDVLSWDGGGLVARTGGSEFLVEDGFYRQFVARLEQSLGPGRDGVYRAVRQDAVLGLSGRRGAEALRHVCGYDFAPSRPGGPLVMTRIAGASCLVLHRELNRIPVFELSTDGTLGVYLWKVLLEIVQELSGEAVGLAAIYPELADPNRNLTAREQA